MCRINAVDLVSMQECLEGYKRLIEWLPVIDETELDLKDNRLNIINYLSNKCEELLNNMERE